jgi:hypothetical protein
MGNLVVSHSWIFIGLSETIGSGEHGRLFTLTFAQNGHISFGFVVAWARMVVDVIHDAPVLGCEAVDWGFGPYRLQLRIIPGGVGIGVKLLFALCLSHGDCVFFCLLFRFIEGGGGSAFDPVVDFCPS